MNALSILRINKKAPYEVKRSRKGFYVFQPEQNISYSISFSEEYEIGGCMSYQFSIDNVEHVHGSYIIDNSNPKLGDITLDFKTTAKTLSK